MNLPPGFTLEEDKEENNSSLPKGFVLETEPEKPKKGKSVDGLGYADAYAKYSKEYDIEASKPQIPGAIKRQKMTEEEWRKDADATYKDKLLGIPEAALSFLTSIPAMVNALPGAAKAGLSGGDAEKEWHRLVDEKTYTPRSEAGQKYTEQLGYAMQPFGLAPYLAPIGPIRGARARKPIEPPRNIDTIVAETKPVEAPKPVEAAVAPEVLTATTTGEVYKSTPEIEMARQAAAQREAAAKAEAQRTVPFEPVDPLELVPKQPEPFRYEGAVEAPELLGPENVKKTFDPVGERQVQAEQLQRDLNAMERETFRDTMPEEFAASMRPELEKSKQAFAALEEQAQRLKQQQIDLEWNKRNETLPERATERVRREEQDARMLATLEDIQASLMEPRISKGQKRKSMRQMGALDFQSIVEAFPAFKDSIIRQPLYHGTSKDKDFKSFNKSPRGTWLTTDPEIASSYAKQNDSQKLVYEHGKFNEINTSSRVHQVYVNIQNPYKPTVEDIQKYRTAKNYAQFQKDLTRKAEAAGHDAILYPDGAIAVIDPKNIKSAFSTGMGRGQAGALRVQDIAEGLKKFRERWGVSVEDSIKTPITEETIKAKQEQAAKAAKMEDILKEKLPQFTDVSTFEEAVSLSRSAPDIKSNAYTRSTASGLNFMSAYHNNPLLRYARKLVTEARGAATKFSRDYVSGPNGVSTAIQALSKDEKVLVNQILTSMDKHQVEWTPELAARVGASEAVQRYMEAHVRAFDANWEWHKSIADKQGLEIGPKRAGYSPGVFYGAYNSLVTAPDKNGKMTVVGMIAADTPGEFMKAKEYYKQQHPESKFSAETWQDARRSFSGGQNQAFKYKNLNQMMELLGSVDGDLAKVNIKVAQDALRASTELYGMDKHNFAKKGISGNQGNKPWMDPVRNATERLDSIVKYLEDSAEYNALQKPSEELRLLMADESTSHMPNAKSYLDDYFRNVAGTYINPVGKILNTAFDASHKLVEEIAAHIPGARDMVGPGNTLKLSNQLKNKMAQWYMGWFNWMFTASQFAQPLQTGGPIAMLAANGLDLPYSEMSKSMMKGGADYVKAMLDQHNLVDLDARTKRIMEYGNNQGILDFTELERAYEGNKSKFGRMYDKTAEFSMQIGEQVTRPPMFFAFVDMLSKVEPNLERVLPVAEHLTNQAMADYHKWERPLMYNGLGVLAPHAGGLTTFKHNFMGTQALLGKEAANIKKGNLSAVAPIGASALSMIAFAGITGTPFYDEMNTIYEQLREKLTGERRSISQDFLNDIDQHWKTGVVSSILDLNMQGKFSSSNMVPDNLAQAAFPHLSGAYDIGKSFAEAAANPNSTNLANAAVAATPSGWKQATRMGVQRDSEGYLLDKTGMRDVQRTPEQWKTSALTGLAPLDEATDKTRRFQNIENEKARKEKLVSLAKDWKAAIIADESPERQGEILDKYEALGGDPTNLIKQIGKIKMEADKTADERLRGKPNSPQGIRRYEAFDN